MGCGCPLRSRQPLWSKPQSALAGDALLYFTNFIAHNLLYARPNLVSDERRFSSRNGSGVGGLLEDEDALVHVLQKIWALIGQHASENSKPPSAWVKHFCRRVRLSPSSPRDGQLVLVEEYTSRYPYTSSAFPGPANVSMPTRSRRWPTWPRDQERPGSPRESGERMVRFLSAGYGLREVRFKRTVPK